MLFNSFTFLFFFAPAVYVGDFSLARLSQRTAIIWIAIASLVFYGWWNPYFLLLVVTSIAINYAIGTQLTLRRTGGAFGLLCAGVAVNLLALFYFKYWNFAMEIARDVTGNGSLVGQVILPIGISFFTFTQIAFLVDAYRGEATEYRFSNYLFFVSYFPHLIAGPIIHHKEIMPQLEKRSTLSFDGLDVLLGAFIFVMGLAKKTLIADFIAPRASALFDAARDGVALTCFEAWLAATLYAFQLYFDFSGYSDMAIGLSLALGIRLPINFNSPYKSLSVIEFWRRWHMTLSRFLRDYLYIPLGGNRRGPVRRYINLMITMSLGGLWHGASWNFLIWGVLHGVYLCANHLWQVFAPTEIQSVLKARAGAFACGALTFAAVTFAWVFFRAEGLRPALSMARAMIAPEFVAPFRHGIVQSTDVLPSVIACGAIVWGLPNTMQLTARWHPALNLPPEPSGFFEWAFWRPSLILSMVTGLVLGLCIMRMSNVTEFIYFNF